MPKSLRSKIIGGIAIMLSSVAMAQTQNWKPAMNGIWNGYQHASITDIRFKPTGPLGKDWIYGKWLDGDSITRYAAYREGGKWVPLSITGSFNGGRAHDIVQYGDTMYIGGVLTGAVIDGDSTGMPWVAIIKYWNDSLWHSTNALMGLEEMAVSGDSLLMWAWSSPDTATTVYPHILTSNGGSTWNYPYSVVHPTEPDPDFGAYARLDFKDGDIYSLNNSTSGPYSGVIRWDGLQWHGFGAGLYGTYSLAYDFDFYKDELYMVGSFSKTENPLNPGQFVARWDGAKWNEVGGGLSNAAVDLFADGNYLYCQQFENGFGDVSIPALAAWDGHQWCGTPINFASPNGPWLSYGGLNFGVIKDTLYMANPYVPATANGQPMSYLNYFDGDYVHGPNAICSTLGLGMEAEEIAVDLQVYPNPTGGTINIVLPGGATPARYELYSLNGQCLLRGDLFAAESTIDLPPGLKGVYLVEISHEGNLYRQKLMVY